MDHETVAKESLQEGGSPTALVSDENNRQFNQQACQVIAVPWASSAINQNHWVSADSFPATHYCTLCQQQTTLLVQSECSNRSQEWLSEDDGHLWGVEDTAISMPERHALVTLCGCSEMPTTHHTPFTGVSEFCHVGNEAI